MASQENEGVAGDADEEFVEAVTAGKAIKLQIYRLGPKGSPEPIWDLHDNYLECGGGEAGQIIKCIERPGTKGRK